MYYLALRKGLNYWYMSRPLRCCFEIYLFCYRHLYKEKKWDTRRMLSSGGMPSSHSATVTSLAACIGLQEGVSSSSFAIAVVLACVVMYDATGVRLHAGRQAELLNQIVCELPPEHPLSNVRPLRDSLGHTPFQVCSQSSYFLELLIYIDQGFGVYVSFLVL
ncbi:hypothetical protein Hanom_Chr08g00740341 [Helianthus anomalus]